MKKADRGLLNQALASRFGRLVQPAAYGLAFLAGLTSCSTAPPVQVVPVAVPRAPVQLSPSYGQPSPAPADTAEKRAPFISVGTGVFANSSSGSARTAAGVQELAGDRITVNFVEADFKDVVKSLLGTTLRLPYSIDPRVQGTLTL